MTEGKDTPTSESGLKAQENEALPASETGGQPAPAASTDTPPDDTNRARTAADAELAPSEPTAEAAPTEPAPVGQPARSAAPANASVGQPARSAAPANAPDEPRTGAGTPLFERPPGTPGGDDEEVEPELIEPPRPKGVPHHPPPPPSLRFKSVISNRQEQPGDPADRRFLVTGTPKLARDLMTRQLFTIGPDDTLEHLEEHMAAFRFRHLPVVEGDKLVGLITHRDLLHASSSFLSERAKERDEIIHKVPARRIMQRELITVRPTTPLSELAVRMWRAKIGCVLVTEEDGKLLGIVTEADFIRLAHHFLVEREQAPS